MTAYDAIIRALEDRHGNIDNIKFLASGLERSQIEMVIEDFVAAASSYVNERLEPVAEFPDKDFAATKFQL